MARTDSHGLGRFTKRMALVSLTGSVASWAKAIHDRLLKTGQAEAAAVFALGPPFAAADPADEDYELLERHVAALVRALDDLLAADAALGA